MASSLSLTALHHQHQRLLFPLPLYKCLPSSNGFTTESFPSLTSLPLFKHALMHHKLLLSPYLVRAHAGNVVERMTHRDSIETGEIGDGSPSIRSWDEKAVGGDKVEGAKGGNHARLSRSRGYRREMGEMGSSGFSSLRSRKERVEKKLKNEKADSAEKMGGPQKRMNHNSVVEDKMEKKGKRSKARSPEFELRVGLDMCSKKGDVIGAISLYDSAVRQNIRLGQYHYNVLLYLCSAAAVGVVQPGKSGSSSSGGSSTGLGFSEHDLRNKTSNGFASQNRALDNGEDNIGDLDLQVADGVSVQSGKTRVSLMDHTSSLSSMDSSEEDFDLRTCENDSLNPTTRCTNEDDGGIRVSEDVKNYALVRGLEIYDKICLENIPLSEAALTSVARMAMAMGNGDMAFEIVKKIKALGLTLRLRSYGPALFAFCNKDDIDRAFEVEQHMLQSGIYPEEPELAALLGVSIRARKGEKVYYVLQKLRTSVRQVSPSTAELIEKWFNSSGASRVGKRKWDSQLIEQAMENSGGGWHGLGWLGKGKWTVVNANVDVHGVCKSCGEKLVTVDIDPIETENFARSVASIAGKRERNSSFQKFQRWLDYYGPFEAVIDAANVGLYSQRRFSLIKVNAIVNGIRQKLPSKKWPLIIVHNKRIYGGKMDEPTNKKLIEKWKNADSLYATPTGSNDDWYWLYAAVKCKGLIVTNDEMRDHLFQVLGNDFFPKWKERHQVHFGFHDGSPQFYMPPACSVIIQESKEGHWHIPIMSEDKPETERTWLCVTRANSNISSQKSSIPPKECHTKRKNRRAASDTWAVQQTKFQSSDHAHDESHSISQHRDILETFRESIASSKTDETKYIVSDLDAAEKLSGCVVDFQI